MTAAGLERAALHYLERYASSAANLRRVLMARVERSARFHETDRDAGASWVEDIIARFVRSGLLNDRAYAELRIARLGSLGYSRRRIVQQLRRKGVDDAVIDDALRDAGWDAGDPDLIAAMTYARRRRLGPYRSIERAERRLKDLAALARVGFDYDIAQRVIDAADIAALEEELLENDAPR